MGSILVNGTPFSHHGGRSEGILADLEAFLQDWYSDTPTMELLTSGSTGTPKTITVSKEAMRASARATCRFFGLQAGASALLCLPLRYIAGKMMVVRALIGGLNLVTAEPGSTPLAEITAPIDFAPLVPMQALTTLQQPNGMAQLEKARIILLGGGFVDAALETALQTCKSAVYASYGMTETLSHIALRRINGEHATQYYTPLPQVSVRMSPRGTLALSVPYLGIENMETNDLAEILPDGRFRILGRADSVINSGGIKIQAESIEQALTAATGLQVMAVPMPHPLLGQAVGLLWEGADENEAVLQQAIQDLPKYHRPHKVLHHPLPRTATGKVSRAEAAAFMIDKTC